MNYILQEIFWSILFSILTLGVGLLTLFKNNFSEHFQNKYLSYWQFNQPLWIILLPVGILSIIHTMKLIVRLMFQFLSS